jgi:hypothetical protein
MNALLILQGNVEQYSIQYEDLITASVMLMMEEASTSKASVITYDFLLLFKKLASGHT